MVKRTKTKRSKDTGEVVKEITIYYFLFVPIYMSVKEIVAEL
jgi:hypothetical protein